MDKQELQAFADRFLDTDEGNYIPANSELPAALRGARVYDSPVIRVGDAFDPLFADLKRPNVIGEEFRLPAQWLPSARSVISLFLPISETIRRDNARDMDWPSSGWLFARYEGHEMISRLTELLAASITEQGYEAVAPSLDPAFFSKSLKSDADNPRMRVTTNWSERHVAYVCGIGTFGLSKGIITEKGMAGRLTSIVTSMPLPADARAYGDIYGYCSRCGVCAKNCPAGAISVEEGKDHQKCSEFLDRTRDAYAPRYGCGKCQVKVPCESRPARRIG